ncbi:MAG: HepT-like ribonuclease domain-containing protein [Thermoanaerobaculia bacterium]
MRVERDERFDAAMVQVLERLPGFRNVVVHEYVGLDLDRVIATLDGLDPVEAFLRTVARIERG